ncbi:hypothetical protein DFO53_0471 [Enterobacter sp. AG5470]|nr:hypothetical protein DFO53_0471 [Enterobacter sp. AG5470]
MAASEAFTINPGALTQGLGLHLLLARDIRRNIFHCRTLRTHWLKQGKGL